MGFKKMGNKVGRSKSLAESAVKVVSKRPKDFVEASPKVDAKASQPQQSSIYPPVSQEEIQEARRPNVDESILKEISRWSVVKTSDSARNHHGPTTGASAGNSSSQANLIRFNEEKSLKEKERASRGAVKIPGRLTEEHIQCLFQDLQDGLPSGVLLTKYDLSEEVLLQLSRSATIPKIELDKTDPRKKHAS